MSNRRQVLEDIADLRVGFPFRSADFVNGDSNTRLLRGDNIGQGMLDWSNAARWPADSDVDRVYELQQGDVVIAMDRPWIGAGLKFSSITSRDVPSLLVQRVARLRAKPGTVQRYLHYLVGSGIFTSHVLSEQTGTAVPHISGQQILRFVTPVHSKAEQRGIAEVLGALDDKIAANRGVVDASLDLSDSLVRAELRADQMVALGDIAQITMGSSPPGTSYNEDGIGTVFYQGVRDFGVRSPRPRVWTTEPVRMAEVGDTLIAVRAPVGEVNLAVGPTCIGRGLAAAHSDTPVTLFHLLRVAGAAWQPHQGTGTVFASINARELRELPLPTVTSSAAVTLEERVSALGDRAHSALQENERLAATRDALLPLLMSGRVRVKDVEDTVGELV